MMKRLFASAVLLGLLSFAALSPASVFAADTAKNEACNSIAAIDPSGGGCKTADTETNSLVRRIIRLLSVIAGIIAVIMIMISGLKYITAQGDAGNLKSAKNALIYAIVGLVFVAFSQIIVQFVLRKT